MTGSPSKRRYVPDASDVDFVKKIKQNEIELRDRNTVLRGIKPNVDFLSLTFFGEPLINQVELHVYSERLLGKTEEVA